MKKKALWITETAAMLALLIALQWVTKPLGQLVTGSCVNAVLAVATLLCGLSSGLTVALLSPLFAYLLGIAPNLIAVPVIMAGNAFFAFLLSILAGKQLWKRILAWFAAAAGKFAVMYALIAWVICGAASDFLLAQGLLKAPMLKALPVTFGVTQLFTALIGGGVALLIVPVLKKALHKA
jgi:hypothetical protein